MKLALAQTKPVTGDLEGNTARVLEYIRQAREAGADVVLFPETAVTGYCCGALFEQEDFVRQNKIMVENVIAPAVSGDLTAVVGFVDFKGLKKSGAVRIGNSAAVIREGKIIHIYDKILMANDNHHEDRKYFTPGTEASVCTVPVKGGQVTIGTPICEDAWYHDHDRDIVGEMTAKGAQLILCLNQSYFYYGKQEIRKALFGGHGRGKGVPVATVNAVGVGDIVKNIMIYDGGSMVFDRCGRLVNELPRFRADFKIVDIPIEAPGADIPPCPQAAAGNVAVADSLREAPCSSSKYEEIFDALVFEQAELFSLIGLSKAQVHVSGGIDSAVVAVLVKEAMGKDNTVFITNPTACNIAAIRDLADAIAGQLDVPLHVNPTGGIYDQVVSVHTDSFGKAPSLTARASMQAVLRTVQGIAASHHFKSGIVATGNHTEIVEGWASFHDIGSIGVHALIGDLTKIEVFQLSAYINERMGKEVIPKVLYDGTIKPAAELPDAAEDPLDYFVRSGIDAEIIRHRKNPYRLIEDFKNRTLTEDFFPLDWEGKTVYERFTAETFGQQVMEAYGNSRRSVFKSAQGAPTVIISPRSRGFSSRETIINRYTGKLPETFAG
ncbi:MAG: hypothetical protein GY765_10175 [bacterium]|nr:hypothetical protein [bacterium]